MNNIKPGCNNVLCIFVAWFALDILTSIWKCYVLSCLWAWFVTGIIVDYQLTTLQIFGMVIFVNLMRANFVQLTREQEQEGEVDLTERVEKIIKSTLLAIFGPALSLGVGYIVHLLLRT